MLDSPTRANLPDFRQRYATTYGFLVRENRPKLMVYISNADGDQVTFEDKEGTQFYAFLDQNVQFEFLPIIRGWYHTQRGARYYQRIPERQYHRGISRGNTASYQLNTHGNLSGALLRLDELEDVFINKPTTTWDQLVSGKASTFIPSPFFLLTKNKVYMYDKVIGQIESFKKIVLESTLFMQEVQDFLRVYSINCEVVCE